MLLVTSARGRWFFLRMVGLRKRFHPVYGDIAIKSHELLTEAPPQQLLGRQGVHVLACVIFVVAFNFDFT